MLQKIKQFVKQYPALKYFLKSPYNWFYSAYLTLRYVEDYKSFPAIRIHGSVDFKIKIAYGAKLVLRGNLILEQWMLGNEQISINIERDGVLLIDGDFTIGNGVRIFVDKDAKLLIKGKLNESASGITANSVIMVKEHLEIGYDCIIAWDTFITDCDWHQIGDKRPVLPTKIGNHIWIGVGSKILKGVHIADNCIIAPISVVLTGEYQENSLVGGNPAKVLKHPVAMWNRDFKN